MKLQYEGKVPETDILKKDTSVHLADVEYTSAKNQLILGENLSVLKCLLYDYDLVGRIDLIYIDPPFATNNTFKKGKDRANTISSSNDDEIAYTDHLMGKDFIEFLRQRLILLRELMSPRASIYLHIDYKIGHYVKIIMDEVFGENNFRNDIARIKCSPKNFDRKAYGNVKDLILFYSKTNNYAWNDIKVPFSDQDIEKLFKKVDKEGRHYTTVPLHAPGETRNGATGQEWRGVKPPKGRHWRSDPKTLEELDKQKLIEWSPNGVPRKIIYADDMKKNGKKLQDVWEFKDAMYPDYPTQKNSDLLDLIIQTSSSKNDLVLDCFAGSGTTILSSAKMERRWIGIDQSEVAVQVAKKKLRSHNGDLFNDYYKFNYLELRDSNEKVRLGNERLVGSIS